MPFRIGAVGVRMRRPCVLCWQIAVFCHHGQRERPRPPGAAVDGDSIPD